MLIDFSLPNGLAQLSGALKEAAPDALYYPGIEAQLKVQGELFVTSRAVDPLVIPAARMPMLVDRLDSRATALMRAVTAV
jgi:hypothetical protein